MVDACLACLRPTTSTHQPGPRSQRRTTHDQRPATSNPRGRSMDLSYSADDEAFRSTVRTWIAEHAPSRSDLRDLDASGSCEHVKVTDTNHFVVELRKEQAHV